MARIGSPGLVALFAALVCVLAVPACSGGGGNGSASDDDDDDDGTTGNWTTLVTADWSLQPLSEDPSDRHHFEIDREIYIGGIRPIAPLGTHHTVLYKNGTNDTNMIYASGVGTEEVLFPPGAGLKLQPGDTLDLELHIFNVGETTLTGTSGIEVIEVPAEDIVNEADIFLPGPLTFSLDPAQETTVKTRCDLFTDTTIFAIFPHMHQLGTHFKTTVTVDGEDVVLHDAPYDFENQTFTAFTPIELSPGDSITTECTWNNVTGEPVGWGESSNAEMCFSILYRWPVQTQTFCPGTLLP